jgi:hypothetical protein
MAPKTQPIANIHDPTTKQSKYVIDGLLPGTEFPLFAPKETFRNPGRISVSTEEIGNGRENTTGPRKNFKLRRTQRGGMIKGMAGLSLFSLIRADFVTRSGKPGGE